MTEELEHVFITEARAFIGKSALKVSKSVFACVNCFVPLVISEIEGRVRPGWKCPKCGKVRNRKQGFWMEYNHHIEFKEGL